MTEGICYHNGEAVGYAEYGDGEGYSFGGRPVTYREGEFPCDALVEVILEDGRGAYACGAPARVDDEGRFDCNAGHEFTPLSIRAQEGWEYAEDAHEADRLRALGVDVVECF